jgi:DNA-binding CsgD family transcriptional regulator
MLADDDDEAAALFEQAIAMFRFANNRIGEGRAELVWGERLRRKRRRAEARVHLERARRLFRTVGVPGWTARADAELAASGAAVDPALPVHALLSAQELRVARLAAGGASNREIGVDLFVSERTVETHLTTIFRKLQIKNRKELGARSVVDADLRAPDA